MNKLDGYFIEKDKNIEKEILIMFFKNSILEIDIDNLDKLLVELFENKISAFLSRANSIKTEVDSSIRSFNASIEKFKSSTAEPDSEDLYISDLSSIKSGKTSYANALMLCMHVVDLQENGTPYEKYLAFLDELKKEIEKVKRTNASFRTVFFAYSGSLKQIKENFSKIEASASKLGKELDRYNNYFNSYSKTRDEVKHLLDFVKEASSINAGKYHPPEPIEDEIKSLEHRLSEIKKKLSELDKKETNLKSSIKSQLAPFYRASKKFDHSLNKNLHIFIEDPDKIDIEHNYNEFINLLGELKNYVANDNIDGVSKEDINNLSKYDIIAELRSLNKLKHEISIEKESEKEIANKIFEKKEALSKLKSEEKNEEEKKKSLLEIKEKISKKKKEVEELFLSNYGKKINVKITL
ncbi:MAG: hypothetical protein ACP5RT_02760 [Candidatus Micrarchaeia archaeon]